MSRIKRKWPLEVPEITEVIKWLYKVQAVDIVPSNQDIPSPKEFPNITPGKIATSFKIPFGAGDLIFQYLLDHQILDQIGSNFVVNIKALDELSSDPVPLSAGEAAPMKYYGLYHGKPIVNMSRTELMDAVVDLGNQLDQARKDHSRQLETLRGEG